MVSCFISSLTKRPIDVLRRQDEVYWLVPVVPAPCLTQLEPASWGLAWAAE